MASEKSRYSIIMPIAVAVMSLLGVTMGASLNYFFSKKSEATKLLETVRVNAYLKYIQANTELLAALDKQKIATRTYPTIYEIDALKDPNEVFRRAMEAEQRVAEKFALVEAARQEMVLYATKPVIQRLVKYQNSLYPRGKPDPNSPVVQLYQSMRNDLMPDSDQVDDCEVAGVIRNNLGSHFSN